MYIYIYINWDLKKTTKEDSWRSTGYIKPYCWIDEDGAVGGRYGYVIQLLMVVAGRFHYLQIDIPLNHHLRWFSQKNWPSHRKSYIWKSETTIFTSYSIDRIFHESSFLIFEWPCACTNMGISGRKACISVFYRQLHPKVVKLHSLPLYHTTIDIPMNIPLQLVVQVVYSAYISIVSQWDPVFHYDGLYIPRKSHFSWHNL